MTCLNEDVNGGRTCADGNGWSGRTCAVESCGRNSTGVNSVRVGAVGARSAIFLVAQQGRRAGSKRSVCAVSLSLLLSQKSHGHKKAQSVDGGESSRRGTWVVSTVTVR